MQWIRREDSALVVRGGRESVSSGDVMSFAVPLVTVPVKVRRSGAVQADGWLPDQVRLGLLETVLGDGMIGSCAMPQMAGIPNGRTGLLGRS